MIRVIISGAGGRDFHNYLVHFKDKKDVDVVAFTATQIPGIEKRHFPRELTRQKKFQSILSTCFLYLLKN